MVTSKSRHVASQSQLYLGAMKLFGEKGPFGLGKAQIWGADVPRRAVVSVKVKVS